MAGQLVAGAGAKPGRTAFLSTVQPIFQNPFEAFSRYRTIDAYLYETAYARGAAGQGGGGRGHGGGAGLGGGWSTADVVGKYPNQFSGGELQRASIARALIPRPSMLVADEPVSMIDASRR